MEKGIKQLSKEEALTLYGEKWWESLDPIDIAAFQIMQKFLCCPFDVFHSAIEECLNRPVYSHEFGFNLEGIKNELFKNAKAPSIEKIIEMISHNKIIIVRLDK